MVPCSLRRRRNRGARRLFPRHDTKTNLDTGDASVNLRYRGPRVGGPIGHERTALGPDRRAVAHALAHLRGALIGRLHQRDLLARKPRRLEPRHEPRLLHDLTHSREVHPVTHFERERRFTGHVEHVRHRAASANLVDERGPPLPWGVRVERENTPRRVVFELVEQERPRHLLRRIEPRGPALAEQPEHRAEVGLYGGDFREGGKRVEVMHGERVARIRGRASRKRGS